MKQLFTTFLVEILSADPGKIAQAYVKAAKQWMGETEDVTGDIRQVLRAVDSHVATNNPLLKIFGEFLLNDVTKVIDAGRAEKSADRLQNAINRWMTHRLPETAQREVAKVVQAALNLPSVWVRSAVQVDSAMRAKMRSEMAGKYLIFNIDDDLLGGMQLIMDGEVLDASWLGRIQKMTALAIKN